VDFGRRKGRRCCRFLSHLNQIGPDRRRPRGTQRLSTCCHGEEPHTGGLAFHRERRAISLTRTAAGRGAKPTCFMWPTPLPVVAKATNCWRPIQAGCDSRHQPGFNSICQSRRGDSREAAQVSPRRAIYADLSCPAWLCVQCDCSRSSVYQVSDCHWLMASSFYSLLLKAGAAWWLKLTKTDSEAYKYD